MPIAQSIRRIAETVTGAGRPGAQRAKALVRRRKPNILRLRDDGETPNNPDLPLVLYRNPLRLDAAFDAAAIFEDLFDANGWRESWRDGMYDFLHWHSATHEVLGIACGWLQVEFGGHRGHKVHLRAGDVVILPAGTGHRRMRKSVDLLIVGAYPAGSAYDEERPRKHLHALSRARIGHVPLPPCDPVFGEHGPLVVLWSPSGPGGGSRARPRAATRTHVLHMERRTQMP